MTQSRQTQSVGAHIAQEEIDALGYAHRPDETTDDPELERPVTPDHSDYGDEYDYPVLEIHEATGSPLGIGPHAGQEPIAFAVAGQDDALDALRVIALVLCESGRARARLHFAPEDYDSYEVAAGQVTPLAPQ